MLEGGALGRARLAGDVGEGGLVGCDQAGAGARLDRHVAQGHAALHREAAHRVAGIFDDIAGAAGGADLGDDRERHVLRRHADGQSAVDRDAHVLGLADRQCLGRQHMLHVGGADAEGERAEGAMGRGVAVAADDGHARQSEALLGTHDMHDALADVGQRQIFDAEFLGVGFERRDLDPRFRVGIAHVPLGRRHVVVGHGERRPRAAHLAAGQAQTFEGLRARHLVHQMAVDIERRRLAWRLLHQVGVPNLVVERLRHGGRDVRLLRCGSSRRNSAQAESAPVRQWRV